MLGNDGGFLSHGSPSHPGCEAEPPSYPRPPPSARSSVRKPSGIGDQEKKRPVMVKSGREGEKYEKMLGFLWFSMKIMGLSMISSNI